MIYENNLLPTDCYYRAICIELLANKGRIDWRQRQRRRLRIPTYFIRYTYGCPCPPSYIYVHCLCILIAIYFQLLITCLTPEPPVACF